MSALTLEDLLADLSDDGVLVSTGDFTLDPKKAEEKLRNFGFTSPHHYILKLIQFAIGNGATWIDVQLKTTALILSFDGEAVKSSELEGLMAYLLAERTPEDRRQFRHLAAALRGAVAVEPRSLSFESWNGDNAFRRLWDQEGWRTEVGETLDQCVHTGESFHRFTLGRTVGQSFSTIATELKEALGSERSEEELAIIEACRYCPATVTLEGKNLSTSPFGSKMYPGYDIHQDPNPGEAKPPPYAMTEGFVEGKVDPKHHLLEQYYKAESGKPASLITPKGEAAVRLGALPKEHGFCRAWLGVRAELGASQITYVEDGVVIATGSYELPCPGITGVFSAELLPKDLTGFQLVEDERYQEHLKWLTDQAAELKKQVLDNLALFPIRDTVQTILQPED